MHFGKSQPGNVFSAVFFVWEIPKRSKDFGIPFKIGRYRAGKTSVSPQNERSRCSRNSFLQRNKSFFPGKNDPRLDFSGKRCIVMLAVLPDGRLVQLVRTHPSHG